MKPIRLTKGFGKHYKQRIAPIKNLRSVYVARVYAFQNGDRGYLGLGHLVLPVKG